MTELRSLAEQLQALKESNEEDIANLRSTLEKSRKDRKQVGEQSPQTDHQFDTFCFLACLTI